ncbi:MAG: precorrin-6A/cobalt-precorrin-6A reductase, partial [Flavobacteriales bacterium]
MILVFGGTTEGKKVIFFLEQKKLTYIYSTRSKISFDNAQYGSYRYGSLNEEQMIDLCSKKKVELIINAAHPFAEELHHTIAETAEKLKIKVIRFERIYPEKWEKKGIHYVNDFNEAIQKLNELNINKLLALTGVQSIEPLQHFWTNKYTIFRILPKNESYNAALKSGIKPHNLIQTYPSKTVLEELEVINKVSPEAILTKESGSSGQLKTK